MAGEGHKDAAERMLSDARLDEIAGEVALIRDDTGLAPPDTGYVTTVDLYRAAAECWREKAGQVADGYDFKAEGASFTRSQMYDHYMEQASRYASMVGQLTVSIVRPHDPEETTTSLWEDFIEQGGGYP
jgi:hypothetical protein